MIIFRASRFSLLSVRMPLYVCVCVLLLTRRSTTSFYTIILRGYSLNNSVRSMYDHSVQNNCSRKLSLTPFGRRHWLLISPDEPILTRGERITSVPQDLKPLFTHFNYSFEVNQKLIPCTGHKIFSVNYPFFFFLNFISWAL